LTLKTPRRRRPDHPESGGGLLLETAPPKVEHHTTADMAWYANKAKRVGIRHVSRHQLVAVIEIVSPGNKSSQRALNAFVDKSIELINEGIHLLIADLIAKGKTDHGGLHP